MHTIDFKEGLVAAVVNHTCYRNLLYDDPPEVFQLWRYDNPLQECLIVVCESYLAGLADAFAVSESFPAEKAAGLVNVAESTDMQHQGRGCGAGSTLA